MRAWINYLRYDRDTAKMKNLKFDVEKSRTFREENLLIEKKTFF